MNSIQHFGLSAFIAASAAFVICIAGPGSASAAEAVAIPKFLDYMKKGKRSEAEARIDATRAEISAKIDAMTALLLSIEEQSSQVEALRSEISSLSSQLETDSSVSAADIDSFISLVDDGTTVFTEQVAILLSPELAAQVTQELESTRQALTATATFSDGSTEDLSERMGALEGSFGDFKSALEAIKKDAGTLDAAVKGSWNIKANVK